MTSRFRVVRTGDPEELAPLDPDETWIRVEDELPEVAWRALADLVADRPEVELSIEAGDDLEALRWFPGLRRLGARSVWLRSLDGLRHVHGSLERLTLGDTRRLVSLRPIEGTAASLRRLAMNGTWSDTDAISTLVGLERLGMGTIDLEVLLPLTGLTRFECGLGTVRQLDLLPEVGRLELVELWRLRGAHDLTPLAGIRTLRYLLLASTRSITHLPSFAACPDLGWVSLAEMRGITDLRPVAEAPALEVLMLVGMPQLDATALRPLVGHPALRAGVWGLGSARRNAQATRLLPLPPANGEPAPWECPDWDGIPSPWAT